MLAPVGVRPTVRPEEVQSDEIANYSERGRCAGRVRGAAYCGGVCRRVAVVSGLRVTYPAASSTRHGSRYDYSFYSDEGYGWIEKSRDKLGLDAVSGWGLDGWDLGDWPYVIYSLTSDRLTVVAYVEGDLTFETFADRDGARARLDAALLFYSGYAADALRAVFPGAAVPGSVLDVPERFRGPFSWHRLAQSKDETCGSGCRTCQRARDRLEGGW